VATRHNEAGCYLWDLANQASRLLMSVAGVPSLLATLVATTLEVSGPLIPQPQMCSDLVDSLGRYK
jgi:hypothetical protein